MADISKDELRKEINVLLKDADLTSMTAKKVRQQLEEKLDCDLLERRKEIDQLVMDFVDDKDSVIEEEDSEEENDKKKPTKRPAPAKKSKAKKAKVDSASESASEGSEESEEESYKAKKPIPKKKAPPKKRGKGSESDSDSDWGKLKKAPAARGKNSGYTRAYKLSPQLATLMGQESMARHEVVKKMWALIKERNLYDPKNKQFAICDDDLFKVVGVKRFRTFGMMKYLKTHFHE